MNEPVVGPQPGDWLVATVRGLHPIRIFSCLAGLALTVLCLAAAEALINGEQIRWSSWWQQPIDQARALWDAIAERTLLAATVRILPLVGVVTAIWCLVGCWIARHELAARIRNRPYEAPAPLEPGPANLVVRQFKNLVVCCPTALAILAVCLFPVIAAGVMNRWLGGPGAILVAVLLPVVLIADLIVLCLGLGFLAWPLMPATIAAENSDTFDALSRCYNYAFMRPIRCILLNAVAIGLASIPISVVLYPFADLIAGLPAPGAPIVFWLAVALAASIFWSLQTLVYLHLRTSIDDVDAGEIVVGKSVDEATEAKPPVNMVKAARKAVASDPAKPGSVLTINAALLILVIANWRLTVWLFSKLGGDDAGWMNWGLGDTFVPAAQGLYALASLLAGLWGMMWLGWPIYLVIRGLFRRSAQEALQAPPASEAPSSP